MGEEVGSDGRVGLGGLGLEGVAIICLGFSWDIRAFLNVQKLAVVHFELFQVSECASQNDLPCALAAAIRRIRKPGSWKFHTYLDKVNGRNFAQPSPRPSPPVVVVMAQDAEEVPV